MNAVINESEYVPSPVDLMSDAQGILESCIGVMDARMELLNDGVADATRTLLKIAHTSLKAAIDGDTLDLQEEASRCLYEADAVLNVAAREADDAATWGALTLLELVRKTVNAAAEAAMAVTA